MSDAKLQTAQDAQTKKAKENWIPGVDRRLEVMNAVPLVLSTSVELLNKSRITDKSVLFIRNIQDLDGGMTMEPVSLDGWEIELTGLIFPYRVVIKATDLLEMEQVEYEMILQCSGNGRNEYGNIKGTPWNQGGVGNVRFAGVPIKAILAKHNVQVDPQVKYVTAEGFDGPMGTEKPEEPGAAPQVRERLTSFAGLKARNGGGKLRSRSCFVVSTLISRLQRSVTSECLDLGRWPRLLHFAPLALEG